MLLIIGKNTDRLHNIHNVATRTQLQLQVAGNVAAMQAALSKSRRNIVVLDERDLDEDMGDTLRRFADEAHLRVLVVYSGGEPTPSAKMNIHEPVQAEWLPENSAYEELATRVQCFRDEMLRVRKEELLDAFKNDEFVIQYQPKVAWLADELRWQTTEAEALIRWRHPKYGLLGPRHFLPEAEQYGFMEQISELVLTKTLAQINAWDASGLKLNGCVNLSPSMLDLTGLATTYTQLALQYKVDCSRIIFELPANGILQRAKARASVLNKMRASGFRISLDDFGASSNCMQAFEVLEFDEIKIHASVLKDGCNDAKTLHSLAALTGLAKNLGIAVCAEGVETEEMFEFLQEIHCNRMQGYLVSEAVMPEIIQSYYGESTRSIAVGENAFAHLM